MKLSSLDRDRLLGLLPAPCKPTAAPRPVCFFAYDTPDDLEPLREARRRLLKGGLGR